MKQAEKYGQKVAEIPLSLSPNNVEFRSLRTKRCACVVTPFLLLEGTGGGEERNDLHYKNMFEALFPHLWKKKRAFFNRKRVGMANFNGFRVT